MNKRYVVQKQAGGDAWTPGRGVVRMGLPWEMASRLESPVKNQSQPENIPQLWNDVTGIYTHEL